MTLLEGITVTTTSCAAVGGLGSFVIYMIKSHLAPQNERILAAENEIKELKIHQSKMETLLFAKLDGIAADIARLELLMNREFVTKNECEKQHNNRELK